MVIARGGGVTARGGNALSKSELQRIFLAYLLLEKQNPKHTVYFNRARKQNGIFDNINTSERKSADNILDILIKCDEFKPSL